MLVFDPTSTELQALPPQPPQASIPELADSRLHSTPYRALDNVSCEYLGGVLVLRGCLPSYYLKQVAQEVVAHLEAVDHIDNRIQVVAPVWRSR
jgi:hypothetical protein